MTALKTTSIAVAFVDGPGTLDAFIVPDTDGTLAVDERAYRKWLVTHVPTGMVVTPPEGARLSSRLHAIGFAQRFYVAAKKIGADMHRTDLGGATFLPDDADREAFWKEVI